MKINGFCLGAAYVSGLVMLYELFIGKETLAGLFLFLSLVNMHMAFPKITTERKKK